MATLNQIAYNIKELMSGGDEKHEQKISTRQIKHWIHYHRAKIITDKLSSGEIVDRRYIQPMFSGLIELEDKHDMLGNVNILDNSIEESESFGWSNNDYSGTDYHEGTEFNRFSVTVTLPHTLNVGTNDGLTDIRLKKRIKLADESVGRWMGWNKLPIKSKDNAAFDWANKFNKTNKPYAIVYNNMKIANDLDSSYISDNGRKEMALEVSGLRYQTTENDSSQIYQYWVDVWGILTDPTKAQKIYDSGGGHTLYGPFDDSISHYPITEEDLPLLISRVAEVEMTLLLKTPEDLIEDNTNTPKINVGQSQQQQ